MGDFKVLKKDGNVELDDVQAAIAAGSLDIDRLWKAVGQGDTTQSAIILFEAGFDLDEAQVEDVKNVIVIATPDDIPGIFYRIWVKLKK